MKGLLVELSSILPWATLVALTLGIANTFWVWLSQPGKVAKERHEALRANLKEHDRRIQSVEEEIKHLPTKDDVHELGQRMARLETELESVGTTVRRIDDYLRSNR